MAGRPRRTRVYDCNYDIGQSYYQPTLDRLDRKISGRPDIIERVQNRPKFNVDEFLDQDMKTARRRAERAIVDDGVFDVNEIKMPKARPSFAVEDEFDDQIQSSVNRIRASKKILSSSMDNDLEDTINTVKRRARIDMGDKLLDTIGGDDEVSGTIRRRAIKMVSRSNDVVDSAGLTKWSALTDIDSGNSAASLRAKATKARLHDLESDMLERSEKQAARDRRAVNMRKVLADNEFESGQSMKALAISSRQIDKKISF